MKTKNWRRETLVIHGEQGGKSLDSVTGARATPIYQTTSYCFKSVEHAANLFALKEPGNIYTRLMNPTTSVLEERMALLEGGVGALALASGQAAITVALINIASAGEEIVAFDNLYGGTYNLFRHTLPRLGISVKFIKSNDLEALEKAFSAKTKAVYAEAIGNPKLDVADMEAVAACAHRHGVPFILDNTFAPYILRPFDFGVDIIVYSATKFIGGHGTALGGLIVDSGKFDWTNGKFPTIADPDPSYHNLDFIEHFRAMGNIAYIVKARVSLLRDLGAALSPFNAFLLLQGLETLPLRMTRHCENALKVAQFLAKHPQVSWVNYPALEGSPERARAQHYLAAGAGAIVGFGIKASGDGSGGAAAGGRFIDALELISHLANVGDMRTLAIHPATTTHQQLSEAEQLATGVSPDFVRLSIGLEHIDDIIGDIDAALKKSAQ